MHYLQESIDCSGHVKHPRKQRPTLDKDKNVHRKKKRIMKEVYICILTHLERKKEKKRKEREEERRKKAKDKRKKR